MEERIVAEEVSCIWDGKTSTCPRWGNAGFEGVPNALRRSNEAPVRF